VIATAIPNELNAAVGHVSKLALPKLSTRTKAEMQQSLLRKVGIYFIAMVCLALSYIWAAPYLFTWFLPQYLDSIFFSQVAALLILAAPLGLLTQYFYATKHTRALYTMHTAEPFVLLTGYAILIPLYGVIGVIIASLLRFVFLTCALLYFFLRDRS
jgi:O-antigen/teichoic acid export membrane protein